MNILLVEDNATLRQMICSLLQHSGHSIIQAGDGQQAWDLLQQEPVQLVLTDWMMPRMDGAELIRRIRAAEMKPYIYIIMLTAKGQPQEIVEGLEAGADDYLVKPFNLKELQARVAIGVRVVAVEKELREARDRLEILATHDDLTGLFNRQAISERAAAELNRAQREKIPLSLILLDIDHFREVNEQHGHLMGDQALRLVAVTLKEALRSYDYAGRWGGEEFLMVLPHSMQADAAKVAERIRTRIAEAKLLLPNGNWLPLTGCLGVAETLPGERLTLDGFIQRAHEALGEAKKEGRNNVHAYTSHA